MGKVSVYQWNSDLLPHIRFENNFLLATKVLWEWEKRELIIY